MRVLVTGGSGFVGRHTIRGLAASGLVAEVVCFDLIPFPDHQINNVPVVSITGDIRDASQCVQAAEDASAIIHLAAVASVPISLKEPLGTHDTNVRGTLNVLEAARSRHVPQVIIASSSAVYGNHPAPKKHEGLPVQFLSPYAASKGSTEGYALAYAASYALEVVAFRFFNVFGPGQTADHPYAAVIPRFLQAIRQGESLQVFGDGHQTRDFVSVHAVVDALVKTCLRRLSSETPVNIASGHPISVNKLIEELARIHGSSLEVEFHDSRLGDVRHSSADTEVLSSLIGDLEQPNFQYALQEVYNWYMAQAPQR